METNTRHTEMIETRTIVEGPFLYAVVFFGAVEAFFLRGGLDWDPAGYLAEKVEALRLVEDALATPCLRPPRGETGRWGSEADELLDLAQGYARDGNVEAAVRYARAWLAA